MIPPLAPYHDYTIGTLIEHPGALPRPLPPLMKRMCAGHVSADGQRQECDLVLGWVVCIRAMAGQISHGMCEACALASRQTVADLLANEYTLDVGPRAEGPSEELRRLSDRAGDHALGRP